MVLAIGLGVILTFEDDGLRCAEMGYEGTEQVCLIWETREGVLIRRLDGKPAIR